MKYLALISFLVFNFSANASPFPRCEGLFKIFHFHTKKILSGSLQDDKYEYGTKFYNSEERKVFEVHVGSDGLLYNYKNELLTTEPGTRARFVMDGDGSIYIHQNEFADMKRRHHHSSYLAGGPIAAVGNVIVKDGVLLLIDNGSGHYWPELPFIRQFVVRLEHLKARLDQVKLENFSEKPIEQLPRFTRALLHKISLSDLRSDLTGFFEISKSEQVSVLEKLISVKDKRQIEVGLQSLPKYPDIDVEVSRQALKSVKDPEVMTRILAGYPFGSKFPLELFNSWFEKLVTHNQDSTVRLFSKIALPSDKLVLSVISRLDLSKTTPHSRAELMRIISYSKIGFEVKEKFAHQILDVAILGLKEKTNADYFSEYNLARSIYEILKGEAYDAALVVKLKSYFVHIAANDKATDARNGAANYLFDFDRTFTLQ